MAVNLTARAFENPMLGQRIAEILAETGLPHDALELEITETMALLHSGGPVSVLQELRKHGTRVAVDDFGIGYSSLSYLRELPIRDYVDALRSYAREGMPLIVIEVAAVRANLTDWTARGEQMLLERARIKYEKECASFEAWQQANSGNDDWRRKPATQAQWFLIGRTADALDIDMPRRLNCGEAYDWLKAHGANLRLRRSGGEENTA